MIKTSLKWVWLLLLSSYAYAAYDVIDDNANHIHLAKPAQRIISLAPHITEILFAIGAGDQIVAVDSSSDFPIKARIKPTIATVAGLDLEKILALQPDLIVAWPSGNSLAQLQKLKQLGFPIYISEPTKIADIPRTMLNLSILTNTKQQAQTTALDFVKRYQQLAQRYAQAKPISLFYAIWDKPLLTINHQSLINEVIELCGGHNIFADSHLLTPSIDDESLLVSDPQVIITSSASDTFSQKRWQLQAVAKHRVFYIDPDLLQRFSPRILFGTQQLCTDLALVRQNDYK